MVALANSRPNRTAPPPTSAEHNRIASGCASMALAFHRDGVVAGLPIDHAIIISVLDDSPADFAEALVIDQADFFGGTPLSMGRAPRPALVAMLADAFPGIAASLDEADRPGVVTLVVVSANGGLSVFAAESEGDGQ